MNHKKPDSDFVGRRAELMAELFLQELDPAFISRPTSPDVGYDLLVGFTNERGGINTFAVEVKPTERPVSNRFQISRASFERFAFSNIPGLLLVVDVKQNRLSYAWLDDRNFKETMTVSVPLIALDDEEKAVLNTQLRAVERDVAVRSRTSSAKTNPRNALPQPV